MSTRRRPRNQSPANPSRFGLSASRRFAGCRLMRYLGGGAFGEVWEARSSEGDTVALKFVRVRGAEDAVAAAARELQGNLDAGTVHHENVIHVHRLVEQDG